jgi:hypothetical protein
MKMRGAHPSYLGNIDVSVIGNSDPKNKLGPNIVIYYANLFNCWKLLIA